MSSFDDLKPVNESPRNSKDPFGDEQVRVVPASMADDLKPDTANLPPAGYRRDEVLAERRRRLDAAIEAMPESGGVDVSTLPIENEVVGAFDGYGNLPVSRWNREKFMAKWKHSDDLTVAKAQLDGFAMVSGKPCENKKCNLHPNDMGEEYMGKGPAQTTGLRGHVDVLLMWIPIEKWYELEAKNRDRGEQQGQVVEKFGGYADEVGAEGILTHGSRNDPLIQRVFASGPEQARQMSSVLKSGTLRGAEIDRMNQVRR